MCKCALTLIKTTECLRSVCMVDAVNVYRVGICQDHVGSEAQGTMIHCWMSETRTYWIKAKWIRVVLGEILVHIQGNFLWRLWTDSKGQKGAQLDIDAIWKMSSDISQLLCSTITSNSQSQILTSIHLWNIWEQWKVKHRSKMQYWSALLSTFSLWLATHSAVTCQEDLKMLKDLEKQSL